MTQPQPCPDEPGSSASNAERRAVILDCGIAAHIRPAVPADREALEALHEGLSPRSIRQRYFSTRRPARELDGALSMPRERGTSRVMCVGSIRPLPVAFGYYVITHPGPCGRAELGLVVAERYQGLGVGRALFRDLALAARADGLAVLTLQVCEDNAAAIAAFRGAGIPHRSRGSKGVVEMTFDLTLSDRQLDNHGSQAQ